MLRLRQAMAFPMYASAAWLVWVLARQAGDVGVAIGLSGGLLVGLAAWTYGIAQQGAGRALFSRSLAAAAVLGLFALLPQLGGASVPERRGVDRRRRRGAFHQRPPRGAAPRGQTGVRQSDRGLVHHLPRQRAHGALDRGGEGRLRRLGASPI